MPMNSAVREMLPPKRLSLGDQIVALERLARVAQRQTEQLLAANAAWNRGDERPDLRRQHRSGYLGVGIAKREDHQALDVVAQLADVPGPVVRLQHRHGVDADLARRHAHAVRGEFEEILDELWNVLAPLSKRRHPDRHHRQAVEQVLAEPPLGDRLGQVADWSRR